MRNVIMLALLIACAYCAPGHAAATRVSGPGFDGVILDMPSTRKDVKIWVPGYDQINEMERALPDYVKRYIKVHKIVLRKPISKYKRHYLGVSENGKRMIGVSYYYENLDFVTSKKWLNGVGDSSSGGDDYLGAVYDVDQKAYVLFEIYPDKKQ
ncbi:MAG TPA: hypothetical protein VGK27_08965 [Candidatus Deferrimicrobiaceae bacterium]